jgi:hypothetical protein
MRPSQKSSAHTLHRLLYRALIELREQGHEAGNKVVFHLADLFHNAVLEMGRAADGTASYPDVLQNLEERAKANGAGRWLQRALAEIKAAPAAKSKRLLKKAS